MTAPARVTVVLCIECYARNPSGACPNAPEHRTKRVYADSARWDAETRSWEVDGVDGEETSSQKGTST